MPMKQKNVHTIVDEKEYKKITRYSRKRRVSKGTIIREALMFYFNNVEANQKAVVK